MGYCSLLLLSCLIWSLCIMGTHPLQSSQTQVLLQLRKHLEYPKELEIWNDHKVDFCYIYSSNQVNVSCQDNLVTQIKILGDKTSKVDNFVGFAIANQTLSDGFSMDSFFATIARLNTLRVLSLVGLGIWGPFPDKVRRLYALEYLDLSSNYLFGAIPPKISTMVKLQTLRLDDNFFNGTIPDCFDLLSNLTVLSLKNNGLTGPFPSSVQHIATLTYLAFSVNRISGKVPSLIALNNLVVLDLSANTLDSNLPAMPNGLVMVFLNNNSFSGDIPKQYGKLSQLQRLDVAFNELSGTPPPSLFSLPNISYLNVASNMLSGLLSDHLYCGSSLQFVDISNNKFIGGLPHCLSVQSDKRVVNFGGNCLSIDSHGQHNESSCIDAVRENRKRSRAIDVAILIGVIGGILFVVVILVFGLLVVCRRYWSREISEQHLLHKSVQDNSAMGFSSEMLNNARFVSQASKLGTQGLPPCRSFTPEELREATNNFDLSTILGEGSFGKLYKGKLENGMQVVIKLLPTSKKFTLRNLKLRLDLLAKLRHPNLVCLLGHCIDGGGQEDYRVNKVFLIYEYVSNGSFRSHLTDENLSKVLSWSERLNILTGIAKAVHFLHTGVIPGFYNNRLKANNILLNEHGIAKLSDYGLSIISEETGNHGENGDGFKSWQMSRLEDDVYSFGFILLESFVRSSISARRDQLLFDELASCNNEEGRKKLVSPIVLATCSQESLSIVISITNKCICPESLSRPSFEDILWNLQYAAQVQATADGEQQR